MPSLGTRRVPNRYAVHPPSRPDRVPVVDGLGQKVILQRRFGALRLVANLALEEEIRTMVGYDL